MSTVFAGRPVLAREREVVTIAARWQSYSEFFPKRVQSIYRTRKTWNRHRQTDYSGVMSIACLAVVAVVGGAAAFACFAAATRIFTAFSSLEN